VVLGNLDESVGTDMNWETVREYVNYILKKAVT
jgi:hypothetical protein